MIGPENGHEEFERVLRGHRPAPVPNVEQTFYQAGWAAAMASVRHATGNQSRTPAGLGSRSLIFGTCCGSMGLVAGILVAMLVVGGPFTPPAGTPESAVADSRPAGEANRATLAVPSGAESAAEGPAAVFTARDGSQPDQDPVRSPWLARLLSNGGLTHGARQPWAIQAGREWDFSWPERAIQDPLRLFRSESRPGRTALSHETVSGPTSTRIPRAGDSLRADFDSLL